MFTDVVGYSSMASADERRTLGLLEEHRGAVRPVIRKHGGTEVKTIGDAFLVEFASAVEAVNCAVEMQKVMAQVNGAKSLGDRMQIRIGIHVGDIVHVGGDVLGDAVNVAARVEPLAEPGGICITRQVVDQVERKVGWKLVRLGTRGLKNISHPVELFKVEAHPEGDQSTALDPRRVAILPFANLSADPNDRYFADGMTEELISTVSSIGELSVISRTSVMRYRDTTTPIGEIGRELSAGTVLEGSVRKAGNKVRVTTQLIDAANDRHLWVQSYDRDVTDIFAIQGDIAGQVAEALRVKLLSKERVAIEKKATENLEAYNLYLKGRYHWNERTEDGVKKAIGFFQQAVGLDAGFALAYSGLADCYSILADRAWLSHGEAGPVSKGYAAKAVELDGELAEAHASLGLALHQEWDLIGAEKEFKLAIALKPNYATAHHWYSLLLSQAGKFQEAYDAERRALELDPYSSIVRQGVGVALIYLGQLPEAIAQLESLTASDPDFGSAYLWKAWAHWQNGEPDLAVKAADRAVSAGDAGAGGSRMTLAWLYAVTGQRELARKMLDEMLATSGYKSPTLTAIVRFGLGENDEAFALLEKALQEHENFLVYFREFPWLAEYRADPRWAEIERKMGLRKV